MSVLLPNTRLGVRRRIPSGLNAHGEEVVDGWTATSDLYPGRTRERADGTWSLGLDPALWPIRKGDLVMDAAGAAWFVRTADLIRNNYDSRVDWVRVDALYRVPEGTNPPDEWLAGQP